MATGTPLDGAMERTPFWGRISVRLALLFALVLAPLLLHDIWISRQHHAANVRRTLDELHRLSTVVAKEHTGLIAAGRDVLVALGQIEDVRLGSDADCSRLMARVARQYERYTVFSRVTPQGLITCSSAPLERPVDVSDAPNIQGAMERKRFALSRFVIGPISGKPVLVFTQPMLDANQEVIGLVNTGLNLDWLDSFLADLTLPRDVQFHVFDGGGRMLAGYPPGGHGVGDSMLDTPLMRLALRQREGRGEVRAASGETLLAGFAEVPGVPGDLFVAAVRPKAQVLQSLAREGRLRLIALAAGLLLSLAVAWTASRHLILERLQRLTDHARRVAAGDYDAATGLAHLRNEMGGLARTYEAMADRLKEREERLRANEERLRLALSGTNDGIWDWDLRTDEVYFSPRWKQMLGHAEGEVGTGLNEWSDRVHPEDIDKAMANVKDHLAGRTSLYEDVHRVRHKDGHYLWILDRGLAVRDKWGEPYRMVGAHTDITPLRRAEEDVRALLNAPTDAVFLMEPEGTVLACNEVLARSLGLERPQEVVGRNVFAFFPEELAAARLERVREAVDKRAPVRWEDERAGRHFANQLYPLLGEQGRVDRLAVYAYDVTELKQQERRIAHLALHDSLTGLPNRTLFMDRLEQAVVRSKRTGLHTALLYIDLDGFKPVNDQYGHEAGDAVLIQVATRVRGCLREQDTAARMGGDEFTAVLQDVEDEDAARAVADRVLQALEAPYALPGHQVRVGASIGVCFCPARGCHIDRVIKAADEAMYRAKRDGGAGVESCRLEPEDAGDAGA
jgi:diguanylate cyclase (GGDEF)-like protein/PAS domain S-box-containing protein